MGFKGDEEDIGSRFMYALEGKVDAAVEIGYFYIRATYL